MSTKSSIVWTEPVYSSCDHCKHAHVDTAGLHLYAEVFEPDRIYLQVGSDVVSMTRAQWELVVSAAPKAHSVLDEIVRGRAEEAEEMEKFLNRDHYVVFDGRDVITCGRTPADTSVKLTAFLAAQSRSPLAVYQTVKMMRRNCPICSKDPE